MTRHIRAKKPLQAEESEVEKNLKRLFARAVQISLQDRKSIFRPPDLPAGTAQDLGVNEHSNPETIVKAFRERPRGMALLPWIPDLLLEWARYGDRSKRAKVRAIIRICSVKI